MRTSHLPLGLQNGPSIVRNIGGSSKISNSWWEYRSYLCWLSSISCDSYGLKIWKSHYLLIGGSDPNCKWYSSREKIWHDLENYFLFQWHGIRSNRCLMFHSRQKQLWKGMDCLIDLGFFFNFDRAPSCSARWFCTIPSIPHNDFLVQPFSSKWKYYTLCT